MKQPSVNRLIPDVVPRLQRSRRRSWMLLPKSPRACGSGNERRPRTYCWKRRRGLELHHPMIMLKQLIEAPSSDSSFEYKTLAYIDAYDEVLDCDYAFVAYREESRGSGEWRVRIRSSQTAGAVFEPDMIHSNARAAHAQGKPWFQWGYSFDPSAGDPRSIQFRVHVEAGKPSEIEMCVRLRKADGQPAEPRSIRFPWPMGEAL